MIARTSSLPLLDLGQLPVSGISAEWLTQNIAQSMENTAEGSNIMPEAVSDALLLHLAHNYPAPQLTLPTLKEAMQKCLRSIGQEKVANRLQLTPPPQTLSLTEFAYNAGEGFLIGFFAQLGERLRHLSSAGVTTLCCTGLEPAITLLLGEKSVLTQPGPASDLAQEILDFLNTSFPGERVDTQPTRLIVR